MTPTYDRAHYWSEVAGRIAERLARRDLAGDDDAFFAYKRRKALRRFLSPMNVTGRALLELGCGPGGNLEYLLQQRPSHAFGVDIAPGMLRFARERLGDCVTLLETDGTTIALPDRSVDLAFTVTVLQHNVDDAQVRTVLGELARVSRGQVTLIEDLAAPGHSARMETFVVRELHEYEDAARCASLRLQSAISLRTRLSRAGWRRLRARFPIRPEGGRQSSVLAALIAIWVAGARLLDDGFPDYDLTKMVFVHR